MAKKIRHATIKQGIAIHALLNDKLVIVTPRTGDEPAVVAYRAGWDDLRVAKQVSPELSASATQDIRIEFYGHLRSARPTTKAVGIDPGLDMKLGILNANIVEIRSLLDMLIMQHNRLAKEVASANDCVVPMTNGHAPGIDDEGERLTA